jgi:hypothetical protein
MIENDAQLDQALEVMGLMYRALAGLRKDILPRSRPWFNLMAQGPADEIRRIQAEIDAYTGRDQVVFDDEGSSESDDAEAPAGVASIDS